MVRPGGGVGDGKAFRVDVLGGFCVLLTIVAVRERVVLSKRIQVSNRMLRSIIVSAAWVLWYQKPSDVFCDLTDFCDVCPSPHPPSAISGIQDEKVSIRTALQRLPPSLRSVLFGSI